MSQIRPAEPLDADKVLVLMAELGRPAVHADTSSQREVFLAHLARPDAAVFVAEVEGEVVGAVSLWFRPRLNWRSPEAWIPDLYVRPAYRRRGVARALLDVCIKEARKRSCHAVKLESGNERVEAHRLYEAYGFRRFGGAYRLDLEGAELL